MDKVRVARRNMERILLCYNQLMRLHPDGLPSIGMVMKWGQAGRAGGRATSMTETAAMRNLTLSESQQRLLAWLDAINAVYSRLMTGKGKNGVRLAHDRKLAVVLYERVVKGCNFTYIRDVHFRQQVSPQYVSKLYDDVVRLVAEEAERRGLYRVEEDEPRERK